MWAGVQGPVWPPPGLSIARTYLREDKLNMTPKRTMSVPSLAPHTAALDLPMSFQEHLSAVHLERRKPKEINLPSRIRRGMCQGREDPPETSLSAAQRAF